MNLFRKYTGQGQYKDIRWWVYKLEKPIGGYTHVYCMPYAINEDMMNAAASGKNGRDATSPDLDKKGTGNIHPSFNDVEVAVNDLRVRQLVLCVWHENIHQYGPALTHDINCDGTIYRYYNADVPAANYYPMITKVDHLTSEEQEKQNILQRVVADCKYSGVAVDLSLYKPRLSQCRYYRGDERCPFEGSPMGWFWDMERVYVDHIGETFIGEGEYYESLGGRKYPGIPKQLLYIMFTSWGKGAYDLKKGLPHFYNLIDEYLEIASDSFPKDKIPSE